MRSIGSIISEYFDPLTSRDFRTTSINPSTGLPMVGGIGGVDVGGNLFGSSSRSHLSLTSPFGRGGSPFTFD